MMENIHNLQWRNIVFEEKKKRQKEDIMVEWKIFMIALDIYDLENKSMQSRKTSAHIHAWIRLGIRWHQIIFSHNFGH